MDDEPESPWSSREERETSGWGWLADDVEQRRQAESVQEEQRNQEESPHGEDRVDQRFNFGGQDDDQSAPRPGALAFGAAQPTDRNSVDPRDAERLARMSSEQLLELAMDQQSLQRDAELNGTIDPWNTDPSNGATRITPLGNSVAESSDLFYSSEMASQWRDAALDHHFRADFSAWQTQDNPGIAVDGWGSISSSSDRSHPRSGDRSSSSFFDGTTSGGTGAFYQDGFVSSGSDIGRWGASWSGGSEWGGDFNSSAIDSSQATRREIEPSGTLGSPRTMSPMRDDGWLATR